MPSADHKAALHFDPTDYQYSEGENLKAAYLELRELAKAAHTHVAELRDAWQRGVISEHDMKGGIRSNRNVDIEVALRSALGEE